MEELCYSPLDLAVFIKSNDFSNQETADFLEAVWEKERPFVQPSIRDNKRKMILETYYWVTYLHDKPAMDAEFPLLEADGISLSDRSGIVGYTEDGFGINLFFKHTRLRILYGGGRKYVAVKRRTLMWKYGYRRMSTALLAHLNKCLYFYHLQTFVRDGVPCCLEDTKIDEMLIFRVV